MVYPKFMRFTVLVIAALCHVLLLQKNSYAQSYEIVQDTSVTTYPKLFSLISDTLEIKESALSLQVYWMDTTFRVERRHARFIEDKPVPKKDNMMYAGYREGPWDGKGFLLPHANCHSFGLAVSFGYGGINVSPLFNPLTFLSPEALEVVLLTAYEKQYTLDGTSMRDLKQPIPQGSLLIFRDSTGFALHTAFQSAEGLLSKNGRFEPRIYHRLEYLKKVYYNAITIDVYTLDTEKVKAYLEEVQLQALLED